MLDGQQDSTAVSAPLARAGRFATAKRLITVGVLLAVGLSVTAGAAFYIAAPVDALRDTLVCRPDGSATTRKAGLRAGANVTLDEIPEILLVALLFNEDKKFFEHHGFDLEEVASSFRDWVRGERRLRGASTLTQQLARSIFLSRDRTVTRKILEALDAVKLERYFTKDEILLLYVNNVEWGPGVYGVASAAAHYFKRKPAELEPMQSVFLVAILPNAARLAAGFGRRRLPHGTTVRMRRLLGGLRGAADAGDVDDGTVSNDPLARIVPAVRGARERANARRVGS